MMCEKKNFLYTMFRNLRNVLRLFALTQAPTSAARLP